MRQAKLNYLLKCVIPSIIFIDSMDDDTLTIAYRDLDNGEIQRIHINITEYEKVCSKMNTQQWVEDVIDKVSNSINTQQNQ